MSQEPTAFELCLPGIVAGLMLATVVLATGETVVPHAFQEMFPHQAFQVLPVAVGLASGLGLMSLFFNSRGEEEKPRQYIPSNDLEKKNSFPSGGTDAL
jgi:hypothetical protein